MHCGAKSATLINCKITKNGGPQSSALLLEGVTLQIL
jgi:hypothetical protein